LRRSFAIAPAIATGMMGDKVPAANSNGNSTMAIRKNVGWVCARVVVAAACALPVLTGSAHAAFGWGIISAADWVKNNPRTTLPGPVNPVHLPATIILPPVEPPLVPSQEPPPLPTVVSNLDQPLNSTPITGNSLNDPLVAVDPPQVSSPIPTPDNGDLLIDPPVAIDPILVQSTSLTEMPEPATLFVALSGLGMVYWRRR
jgi:hypothetical protein